MKSLQAQVIPLPFADINTDMILPARYLTTTVTHGLGQHLFTDMCKMNISFPFNLKKYDQAKIIVSRRNFGCGSSREHAAWSIVDYGIKVIIASGFADIFYSNAIKNHLLLITLDPEIIESIFVAEKQTEKYVLHVDLEHQKITFPDGTTHSFEINGYDKYALIHKIDNLDYLLSEIDKIKAYDEKHRSKIFLDTQAIYES